MHRTRTVLAAAALQAASLSAQAKYVNDPPPVLVDAKPTVSWNFGGYNSYGDGGVAVLYSGEVHTWTLGLPQAVAPGNYLLTLWMAADDHYGVDSSNYRFSVALMGGSPIEFNGLSHGRWAQPQTWTPIQLPVAVSGSTLTLQVRNTSTLPASNWDWIAIDRAQLVTAVPEPASVVLMLVGLAGMAVVRRRSRAIGA